MNRSSFKPTPGGRGIARAVARALLSIPLLLVSNCSSDLGFSSFILESVDPFIVFETSVEVVKSFYTEVHGGVDLQVDEKNLSLMMGPLVGKPEEEHSNNPPQVFTSYVEPVRQKLYLRVQPTGDGAAIEIFAIIETLSIDDPDKIKTEADIWRFKKKDTEVEEQLYNEILRLLVERGVLR